MRKLAAGALSLAALTGCNGMWTGVNVTGDPGYHQMRRQDIDTAAEAGVGWVRVWVPWNAVDRGPGRYHWDDIDTQVAAARSRHMRVLGVLHRTARWARPAGASDRAYPVDPATYGRFAVDAQRHNHFDVLQIGNEPDLGSMVEDTRPGAYAPILHATVAALRRHRLTVPVLFAALSPVGTGGVPFLARSLELGLGRLVDGYALNTYNLPGAWSASGQPRRLQHVRQMVDGFDTPAKRIWLTEYGYPARGSCPRLCVSDAEQAVYLADFYRTVNALRGPWRLGPAFWFGLRDWGRPDKWNGKLGLIPTGADSHPRAALDVLAEMAA